MKKWLRRLLINLGLIEPPRRRQTLSEKMAELGFPVESHQPVDVKEEETEVK